MKRFTSKNQKIGKVGESLVCIKLKKLGFNIIERNYTQKEGEIDIVAQKGKRIHFVEVKSVSCENLDSVTYGTYSGYRPEENLNFHKFLKISRTVNSYLLEKDVSDETLWQIDLATVYIDIKSKKGRVSFLKNIII